MAILYNKMERIDLNKADGQRFWYPVIRSRGLVKVKKIAEKLSKKSVLSAGEIEVLISQLCELMMDRLLNGETVEFGEFGSFRVTVKAEPSDSEREVTAAKIKKVTIRFTESGWLKHIMKEAEFLHVSALAKREKKKQ